MGRVIVLAFAEKIVNLKVKPMSETTESQPITWQQLKDFVNAVPDEFLQQQIPLLHGDQTLYLCEPGYFPEDLYIHKDDPDDGGPLKDLQDLHGEDFDINEYRFQPAGWPFLWSGE